MLISFSVKKYGLNMLGVSFMPYTSSIPNLTPDSVRGRPSESLRQEDHVAIEQVDGWRENL